MGEWAALLPEIERVAREAGSLAQRERSRLEIDLKPDGSVVTNADLRVEEYLRKELPKAVPGTNVWGEEFGHSEEGQGGLWAVDPVDGTTNFAFGSPLWGVTVALIFQAEAVAGCVCLPDLGEVYAASVGCGASGNGEPLAPIAPGPIKPHNLFSCSETVLSSSPGVRWPGKWRCAGSFVVDAMFVATQRYRGMAGMREKLYDAAASIVINRELGADIRYADGRELRVADLLADRKIESPWLIFPRDSGFRT